MIQPGAAHGYKVSMIFSTEFRAIISVTLLMIGYFEMVFAMSEQESPVFSLGLIRMGYF